MRKETDTAFKGCEGVVDARGEMSRVFSMLGVFGKVVCWNNRN